MVPEDLLTLSSENVIFEGHQSNEQIMARLSECSALINPIRIGSGTRNCVLDAMASGMPVISTAEGLENLDNLEYPSFSEAESFSDAIIKILEDPDYSKYLSKLGLDYTSRYCSGEAVQSIYIF